MLVEKNETASGISIPSETAHLVIFFHLRTGASSGNSGIWHTGFDCSASAPLERQLLLRSNELAPRILPSLSLLHPAPGPGALLVAWSPDEQLQLAHILAKASANQCTAHLLSADQLYEREPALQAGSNHTIPLDSSRSLCVFVSL